MAALEEHLNSLAVAGTSQADSGPDARSGCNGGVAEGITCSVGASPAGSSPGSRAVQAPESSNSSR